MSKHILKDRNSMDEAFKWNLEDIFATNEDWEKDFDSAQLELEVVEKLKGTLGTDGKTLFDALEVIQALTFKIERLFVYSRMHRDEDNGDSFYQGLCDRATSLMIKGESVISFVEPEILAIDTEKLEGFFNDCPELKKYRHMIDVINHAKAHILPKEQEQLLAMTGEISQAPNTIYSMMCNADMQFPFIKDADGNDVQISHGNYIPLMESTDRNVRKAAFDGLYSTYKTWNNTIASTLSSSVKKDIFYARARKYNSALEASLHTDNVSTDVYKNLISAIHGQLPSMYRYMDIKRQKLDVEKLHMYDLYVPMFEASSMKVTYKESCDMVLDALKPLGNEYINTLKGGLDSGRWIDVYENKGKTSGAYSWGVWGTHPYVLLNWNNTIDNAFTLAHELGHAMHSHLADTTQPYVDAQYPLILAEVASTFNEALFMRYMLKNTSDKVEKQFLTNYFLEQFRTTMFRQVMFSEFEMKIHDMAESGKPLTADSLNDTYMKLNELYYGKDMAIDELISLEWARIPHFYRAFYVYKYATGFASAIALSNMVLEGSTAEQQRYLNFLKSGGKNFPLDLLKEAGVDLTKPDTVAGALKTFTSLVNEMEQSL